MKTRTPVLEYWSAPVNVGLDGDGKDIVETQFYCHLLATNGKILLVSEAYKRLAGVRKVHAVLTACGARIELRKRKL